MLEISILDLLSLSILLIALIIILTQTKLYFSKTENIIIIIFLVLLAYYHFINFLEWANINQFLSDYEDYFAILIPLCWIFFLYMHIEKINQKQLKARESKLNLLYERTDLYKNLFAHDVKNIFQNIQSATDLCKLHLKKLDNYPSDSIFIFETIEEQIKRGRALAEKVYKLSQVQKFNKPLERVNVVSLLQESSKNVLNSYPLKNIHIDFENSLNDIYVLADNFLLDVFENILNNAISHNDKMEIMIKIKISGHENPEEKFIFVHILDNGPGIDPSIREKLFKGLIPESKIGMGLGLFLVKLIINNYDGDIGVEDNMEPLFGGGSKFTVKLKKA